MVKKDRAPEAAADEASADPNAIRTLVLTGLPGDLTKAVLWKKIRKVNGQAEIEYPVEGEENTAYVVFPTHGDAIQGIPKLHGHTYKGALMSCVLKKRLDKLSTRGEGRAQSHAGRLIVRNLAWETTEADLRATFLPFGPIQAIDLPTLPSKLPTDPSKPPPPPRARGFAFVWFTAKKDAERAMEKINGKPIKRAPDAGVAKGKEGRVQRKQKGDTVGDGRIVAVDWALSKDKFQDAQGKEKEGSGSGSGSESESDSDSESSSGSDSDSDSDEENNDDEEDDDDEEDTDEADAANVSGDIDMVEDEEEEEDDAPVKPKLPDTDVGATLFVRNLPFEATEHELGTLFRSFGPIRYARITMDKATGRSRGTGFVCFWNIEHANDAIHEAERVAQETGANAMPLGEKKNPFALPSVLQADPSASLTSRLVLHGRTLSVSRAVTREVAGNLSEDAQRAREKGDKRNTYLMREGVVFPNSPAASSLPPAEVEKRQLAFNARKTLLRSNPSLYISKTRLSIRNLPLFLTDRGLKRLGIYAVREFDAEVAKESREPLSRIEEQDDTMSPALEARTSKKKRGERPTSVVQSKVVRQNEKLDPLTGTGRSKGYGFLELRSHKEALKVLRWANNNAAVGPLVWDWWVEEMKDLRERCRLALEKARAEGVKEGKEGVEELESRLKKLDARLAEGDDRSQGGMRGGKTLLIEFSIENVQVVKRRVDKVASGASSQRERKPRAAEDSDDEAPRSGKRRRDDDAGGDSKRAKGKGKKRGAETETKEVKPEAKGIEKMGAALGSMIGRKRKARRGK